MFGVNPISGSVQWLGVPHFLRTSGPPWTDNIFATNPSCGNGGTATNPNWVSKPGGTYGSIAVPWSDLVCAIPAYIRRSPETWQRCAPRP